MGGPYSGKDGAAGETARRLAGSSLPCPVAGLLKTLSAAGETARPVGQISPPPGWRMEADCAGGFLLLEESAGGPPRLWAAMDAAGWLHALLDWRPEGLGHSWLRLPGGEGLEIHPGAARHPLWGHSDELRHITGAPGASRSRTAGLLPSLPYHRLEMLPPFDRPGGLPPGAGGAVLNLLARLMRLQGRQSAHYRGPYPTAALFESLGRCFRPALPGTGQDTSPSEGQPNEEQLRARFCRDEMALSFRGEMVVNPVAWEPAPFAQLLPAPDVLVNIRDGVETVWIRNTAFRFRSWRNGLLAAGASIWRETEGRETVEGGPTYGVGLAMLGRPWRRFLIVGHDGGIRERNTPRPHPSPHQALPIVPLADLWRPVIFCWGAVGAIPALAPAILELEPSLPMDWAPLELCLAEASPEGGLLLNTAMAGRFLALQSAGEKGGTGGGEESGTTKSHAAAMMMISDVLGELTPHLRGAAQGKLVLEPLDDPGRLVELGARQQAEAQARLERALPALVAALQRGEALPPVLR